MEFKTDLKDITEKEKQNYINFVAEKAGDIDNVDSINVKDVGDGNVMIEWTLKSNTKFERIRRITGYLVGTVDRWNNAKQAELGDRVKHN